MVKTKSYITISINSLGTKYVQVCVYRSKIPPATVHWQIVSGSEHKFESLSSCDTL